MKVFGFIEYLDCTICFCKACVPTDSRSVKNGTFRIRSWSSTIPNSLPIAWAIRFPATKLPTSIEAGPTSTEEINSTNYMRPAAGYLWIVAQISHFNHDYFKWSSRWVGWPGCFWRGLGRLVTQVCGHMRILQGCRFPSRKLCLVSQIWIPPRGVFGRVLAGTSARQ